MTPALAEAFCLSLPGVAVAASDEAGRGGRAFAVAGSPFAVLAAGGGLSLRCGEAAARLLAGRAGVGPASPAPGGAGCWVALAGLDVMPEEELLDRLRLAYGLAVAGLPADRRREVVAALSTPPRRH